MDVIDIAVDDIIPPERWTQDSLGGFGVNKKKQEHEITMQ